MSGNWRGKMPGNWICENCKSEFEDEDMNADSICEICSDEDHLHQCKWKEIKNEKLEE